MPQARPARTQAIDERTTTENGLRRPVEKFHEGSVHVSIWENAGPKGAFRTASFQLRYRDQQQEWQTGHSYGLSDLKHLEIAAKEARDRIEQWQKARPARDRSPGN